MKPKYRIYIDEVGNPDLESSDNPNHRFLSLTGVILDLGYVETIFHGEMEALKQKYFDSHPDDPLVFHRKEILNAKPPFHALQDDALRISFDADLLLHLQKWEFKVITVCIDKKEHKEKYTTWRHDPYHYCLEVLLERYAFFLGDRGSKGDCMAESRGGKADMRLKKSYEGLWKRGTDYVKPDQFQNRLSSRQLKVKLKTNNIAGLQLADLIAHPSRNEILHGEGLLEREPAPFAQKVIQILQAKYRRKGTIIDGFGRILLP